MDTTRTPGGGGGVVVNELFEKSDSSGATVENGNRTLAFDAPPRAEDWDNTPVSGAATVIPPSETFVIPIDAPEGKLKSSNRQANTYAAKKTVAQGMMDIALITANANQLRYIVEYTSESRTYYFVLTLIIMSLILQVGVGLVLIFKGRLDLRGESKMAHARKMNNIVVVGVFLVTIINVFIASFTITNGGSSSSSSNTAGQGGGGGGGGGVWYAGIPPPPPIIQAPPPPPVNNTGLL